MSEDDEHRVRQIVREEYAAILAEAEEAAYVARVERYRVEQAQREAALI